jgi:hypothetical protein
MSDTTIGNRTHTATWQGTIYQNEVGSLFSGVAGMLHRLGIRAFNADSAADVSVDIVVWDASNNVLGYGTTTISGAWNSPTDLEVDLISPVALSAGTSYKLGMRWIRTGSANISLAGVASGWDLDFKDGGYGYPPPALTNVNYNFTGCFWGYVTPGAAPDKPTTEAYGDVAAMLPTLRLYAHTADAGAVTGLSFVVSGNTPAHGPATVVMTGGPWASGSWVSYTLDPADLGWTPGAGDQLSYHGIASNTYGTTTGDESAPISIPDLGTLTIDASAAPTLTVSWTALDGAAGYLLLATPAVGNTDADVGCSDNPALAASAAVCLASAPAGASSLTVTLAAPAGPPYAAGHEADQVGYLLPGAWKLVVVAGRTGPRSSVATLTVACPSPWPWPESWVDASGTRHYTANFEEWFDAFTAAAITGSQVD